MLWINSKMYRRALRGLNLSNLCQFTIIYFDDSWRRHAKHTRTYTSMKFLQSDFSCENLESIKEKSISTKFQHFSVWTYEEKTLSKLHLFIFARRVGEVFFVSLCPSCLPDAFYFWSFENVSNCLNMKCQLKLSRNLFEAYYHNSKWGLL